ncbi:MAG: hypothetical protein AAF492_11285, partial [Verrucomicrobiota bacterium]
MYPLRFHHRVGRRWSSISGETGIAQASDGTWYFTAAGLGVDNAIDPSTLPTTPGKTDERVALPGGEKQTSSIPRSEAEHGTRTGRSTINSIHAG